ncbi:MAG TPA: YfhO family protein, partial [Puia sp.]
MQGKLPIPSDTIVGLYHPFRDLYAKEYPNGIPYKNFLITDPVRQQYPWRFLAVSLEKAGQLPLWNPYSFGGTPLMANFQTAAFYPLNILLFIFPFSLGWGLLILSEQILAGIFMYWYLSNLRLNYSARFLGSLVYAFCGFMIAWLEWGTLDSVAVWLPLILLSIDKIFTSFISFEKLKNKNQIKIFYIWPIILILVLTFSFFAGHLQPFFYLSVVSVCYFFARWVQFGKSNKTFFIFVLLGVCFLLLTAIQWIPTAQFIFQSARNADQLNSWQQPGWFIPWQNLIQFVAPDFFGNPTTLNYWGIWNYGEFIGYVGIFPLIMAIFALFYRHDKKTFFFGTFFFLSLIFSLPTIFAKIPYIFQFPFFATSQPTRLLFLTDFSLSILSAFGLDFYITSEKKKKILYPVILIFIIFAGLWFFVFSGYKALHISPDSISISRHNLFLPTGFLILITVLLAGSVFIKKKKISFILILILLLISVIDLFRFADKFIPFTSENYLFPSTAALSYLQNQKGQFRIMETDSEILPPNFSVMYHLQSLDGY